MSSEGHLPGFDGATGWQKFRRVTFPLLGPSTFFLMIMNLIYSFQIFDTVFAMTAGGPDYSTTTLVTLAYRTGFDEHGSGQLGYAATIGVVIYLITLAITIWARIMAAPTDRSIPPVRMIMVWPMARAPTTASRSRWTMPPDIRSGS